MKAEELKIGNYIDFNGMESIIKKIDEQGVVVFIKETDETVWIDLFQFSPIPLTEEILLKCGFDRTEYNDYRHPVLIGTLTLYEGVAELHMSDMYSVWANNLHQLQNLYFALCGEELEVKLWI